MKQELLNEIKELAKQKPDGWFSKKGWKYQVKDGFVKHVGNQYEGIYYVSGDFLVSLWQGRSYDFNNALKQIKG